MRENNKIHIGFVGCGWITDIAHIPAFQKVDDVCIHSVFDFDQVKADTIKSKYGIKNAFYDYDAFLDSDLDAVVICSPNFTHADYAVKALNKKKHVMCEKPVAINMEEMERVVKAARCNDRLFIPAYVNRFREDVSTMLHAIEKYRLGTVKRVEGKWLRRFGVPRPGTWFTSKKLSGGGVLIDLGPHIIDICLELLKSKNIKDYSLEVYKNYLNAENISAAWFETTDCRELDIDVEDGIKAQLLFEEDLTMDVELSWLAPVENDFTSIHIECESGSITLKTLFGFSKNKLWDKDTLILNMGDHREEICFDPANNNAVKAFEAQAQYFADCVSTGRTHKVNFDEAYYTTKVIDILYKAM